jgi:hypothetical protein
MVACWSAKNFNKPDPYRPTRIQRCSSWGIELKFNMSSDPLYPNLSIVLSRHPICEASVLKFKLVPNARGRSYEYSNPITKSVGLCLQLNACNASSSTETDNNFLRGSLV